MTDTLKNLLDATGSEEPPEVAAVFDAVPGWHAVLIERTGMKDTNDPDTKYGKEYMRILSLPIVLWGVACPSRLVKRTSVEKQPELKSSLGSIFGDILAQGRSVAQQVLPLDPRHETPTFFRGDQLVGICPPSEGDTHEVLAKFKKDFEKRSEQEIARAKKREERPKP